MVSMREIDLINRRNERITPRRHLLKQAMRQRRSDHPVLSTLAIENNSIEINQVN